MTLSAKTHHFSSSALIKTTKCMEIHLFNAQKLNSHSQTDATSVAIIPEKFAPAAPKCNKNHAKKI